MGVRREKAGLKAENGQAWKPPLIGVYSQRLLEEGLLLKNEGIRNGAKGAPWREWDTPLYSYSVPLDISGEKIAFDRYLKSRVPGNGPYVVVDVGFGSGRQWRKFLHEHRQIEFWGTALSMDRVMASMQKRTAICSAGAIGSVFPAGYVDFLASHFGFHREADLFAAAIANVLKENGEAVITARRDEIRIFEGGVPKARLEVVGVEKGRGNDPEFTVHLRKMA